MPGNIQVARAPSTVSCSNGSHSQYGHPSQYGQYERTATVFSSFKRFEFLVVKISRY